MSDKSEEPTEKKKRDARSKGQVAKSQDVSAAMTFIVGFSILLMTGGGISTALQDYMRTYINWSVTLDYIPPDGYNAMFVDTIWFIIKLVIPMLAALFVVSLAVNAVQVGLLFTLDPLKPDLKKINPLSGIKKWFSPKTLIELLKSMVKMVVAMVIAYGVIKEMMPSMILSVGQSLEHMNVLLSEIVYTFTIRVAVVFLVIAAADFVYQKKSHMKDLKMSKDEVKREYKEDEGDPMFKHKRKELAHELVFNNMMGKARKATAVVVNPTHYAACILYDKQKGGAPKIIAKGQNLIAEQLKQIAKEEKIPIIRNITLAQALNRVELDSDIPEELYQAVAEVLNFVYRLGQQERRR